jgi:D-amino-acid oxidase
VDERGVKEFEVLDLKAERGIAWEGGEEERVPDGAIFGVKYKTVCINIPQYLSNLFRTLKEGGTAVIKADVDTSHGLEGAVRDSKRILMSHTSSIIEEDIFAVIDRTGLGARHLVGHLEAAKLHPIRGQPILVKSEASKARSFVEFGSEDELVYVIPRPGSGTTILGGCKQVGNWSEDVDEELYKRILERVKRWGLAEELRMGRGREFEVLSWQVGLRPGREGGPRVEVESGGRVDGTWVVHSYGHSGGGYQCSLACAQEVAGIVAWLESNR